MRSHRAEVFPINSFRAVDDLLRKAASRLSRDRHTVVSRWVLLFVMLIIIMIMMLTIVMIMVLII